MHDFRKSTAKQQKDISDLERQLAALSGDNSASARAKRAQLEAELAEARESLESSYYDRSISNQQNALDKELENFQEEKDKEMEGWDQYLENTEQVVADSLAIVQANTDTVMQTLNAMGQEYGLAMSESLTSPWEQGSNAIQDFCDKFGLSMSATVAELQRLADEHQAAMDKIDAAGNKALDNVNKNIDKYQDAEKKPEEKPKNDNPKKDNSTPSLSKGSSVTIKKSATHFSSNSGNKKMLSFVPGGKYTVYDTSGNQVLIGKNGVYTGWVNKKDIEGFAKGTLGVDKDQLALIDELGEELVIGAKNGRLTYLEKGSGVIPADLTSNLMEWGKLDPSVMLDQNRPSIGVPHEINNTTIQIDNSIAELIHIDKCETGTLPDVKKIVNEALEKHTQRLNMSLRKFTR